MLDDETDMSAEEKKCLKEKTYEYKHSDVISGNGKTAGYYTSNSGTGQIFPDGFGLVVNLFFNKLVVYTKSRRTPKCLVCMEKFEKTTLQVAQQPFTCKHEVLCNECLKRLKMSPYCACPMCRSPLQ
jgi:hypothetical protein